MKEKMTIIVEVPKENPLINVMEIVRDSKLNTQEASKTTIRRLFNKEELKLILPCLILFHLLTNRFDLFLLKKIWEMSRFL